MVANWSPPTSDTVDGLVLHTGQKRATARTTYTATAATGPAVAGHQPEPRSVDGPLGSASGSTDVSTVAALIVGLMLTPRGSRPGALHHLPTNPCPPGPDRGAVSRADGTPGAATQL